MIKSNSNRVWILSVATAFFLFANGAYFAFRLYTEVPQESFVRGEDLSEDKLNGVVSQNSTQKGELKGEQVKKAIETVDAQGLSQATAIIQTARGKIKFKFYSHDAPKTVGRIAELIQKGFYNGVVFHRVEPQFVVQTGDPTGSGRGGSGTKLKAEFNSRKHLLGTVAMARLADPDSADSQFYICLDSIPHLDGKYTVFGQVVEGQEVVNQIKVGDRMTSVTLEI